MRRLADRPASAKAISPPLPTIPHAHVIW